MKNEKSFLIFCQIVNTNICWTILNAFLGVGEIRAGCSLRIKLKLNLIKKKPSNQIQILKFHICYTRASMHNIRPASQMWPAEALCLSEPPNFCIFCLLLWLKKHPLNVLKLINFGPLICKKAFFCPQLDLSCAPLYKGVPMIFMWDQLIFKWFN